MSGKRAVLDTNILIYCAKGQLDFLRLAEDYDELFISVISYMEALGYAFPNSEDQALMEELLTTFPIVHTNQIIADRVVSYRRIRKMKVPDAIILATAGWLEADLITRNLQDFNHVDPTVDLISPALAE